MATKIRLKRIGRRNRPFYRLIVIDSRKQRDGAAIEEVGWYNPIDVNHSYDLKGDRILHWLSEGAIPSDAVHKLMKREGLAHRWHLMQQGMDEAGIEKEMKKWELNRKAVLEARAAEKETKKAKAGKEKAAAKAEAEVADAPTKESEPSTTDKLTESGPSEDEAEASSDDVTKKDDESQDEGEESETPADDSPDKENTAAEESDSEDTAEVDEDDQSEEE